MSNLVELYNMEIYQLFVTQGLNKMKITILILIFIISGCAAQKNTSTVNNERPATSETEIFLSQGRKLLSQNNTTKAIIQFDEAIELCKEQYNNHKQKHYAARGLIDTIYYMALAASENISAVAVNTSCSDALYLKGYANLDLGKIEVAEKYLLRAVEMSPINSMYLSELGHIYQTKRDWENALYTFQESERYADTYSPPELKTHELSRAKRGVGFALIELGKLDEAETKFKECLEINKNDKSALNELKYIESLRIKKTSSDEL